MAYKAKRYDFCKRCGELFLVTSPNKLFCTRVCTLKYEVENYVPVVVPQKECAICGELFTPKSSGSIAKYCSNKCRHRRPRSNPEKLITYRKENRQRRSEYNKQWAADNPEKKEVQRALYRARKAGAEVESSWEDRRRARKAYKNTACNCCGWIGTCEIDHVIPLSKGGPDIWDNFQPLCKPCNQSKGNREFCKLDHATP